VRVPTTSYTRVREIEYLDQSPVPNAPVR